MECFGQDSAFGRYGKRKLMLSIEPLLFVRWAEDHELSCKEDAEITEEAIRLQNMNKLEKIMKLFGIKI
jgi:hypothetical protein